MEQLIKRAHQVAKDKGFWETERNVPEMLMLVVSELAEALEALRKDHYADKSIADELFKDIEINKYDDEFNIMSVPWKAGFERTLSLASRTSWQMLLLDYLTCVADWALT